MKNACAVVVAVVLTAACVSTNAAVMNKQLVRPAIKADSVILYRTPQDVARPYDEVAILNSKGDAGTNPAAPWLDRQMRAYTYNCEP